jgi:hypothetical protein
MLAVDGGEGSASGAGLITPVLIGWRAGWTSGPVWTLWGYLS